MKTLTKKTAQKRRPTLLNGTVPPARARNRDVRPREYLTPKEVERLVVAAKKSGRRLFCKSSRNAPINGA
jgi:hypothetical protein